MKNQSVLILRAMLFAAIVLIAAVAVGLPTFLLMDRHMATVDARSAALPQARILAESAGEALSEEAAPLEREAALLGYTDGVIWLANAEQTRSLTGETAPPAAAAALVSDALKGKEALIRTQVDGKNCAVAAVPVSINGFVVSALLLALPIATASSSALIAVLVGLFAALVLGIVFGRWLLLPVVQSLAKLRDVAVSVTGGNLEAKASERAPGELGELGKALNNLSMQLARNLYTLIIERNRLQHMIDGLSEGIVAVDNEGHVTHTNPALARMFTKQKPTPHMPDLRMKFIPDKTIWEDFDDVIQSGQSMTRNLEVRDMVVRLIITPIIDEIGTIAGAVGLFSDITQMERLERTRRDYVSNVSHELRTPLTAMRALIEPLKEGMVTTEADRMRYYDIILREVMRLSRLINDQLELSRLQSGTLAIQKNKLILDDLVYDVCDRYSTIAEEHGLELKVLTDFTECPPVFTNPDRAEQMLIILLDNAIKYTDEGSVSVSATWDDEKVILSVRDTGIGIAEEDLPYVFERFYKVDKAHSGKGSGLGLSIAKELLKRMDEEIWVTSEQGVGTEFSFTLHRYKQEGVEKTGVTASGGSGDAVP